MTNGTEGWGGCGPRGPCYCPEHQQVCPHPKHPGGARKSGKAAYSRRRQPDIACQASAAEFAPDPALDPVWISYWEPFHGAAKKDFGFQITLIVAPDDAPDPDKKPDDKPASLSRR